MTEQECRNKVRCAMSDRTGLLRFKSFDIVEAPECAGMTERIRCYLIGRALAEVDLGYIREIGHDGHALCCRVVAQLVAESQGVFLHRARVTGGRVPDSPRATGHGDRA